MTLALHFGRVLTGSEGGQSRPAEDFPRILGELTAAGIDCSGFISHRGNLVELDQIMAKMRSGEVIHALAGLGH